VLVTDIHTSLFQLGIGYNWNYVYGRHHSNGRLQALPENIT